MSPAIGSVFRLCGNYAASNSPERPQAGLRRHRVEEDRLANIARRPHRSVESRSTTRRRRGERHDRAHDHGGQHPEQRRKHLRTFHLLRDIVLTFWVGLICAFAGWVLVYLAAHLDASAIGGAHKASAAKMNALQFFS